MSSYSFALGQNSDGFCRPIFSYYGYWNAKNHYLGLVFQVNGDTYYGWAELSVIVNGSKAIATLTGYAYENIPGMPINAGQTTDADDSSALIPDRANPEDSGLGASVTNPTQAVLFGMLAPSPQEVPLWRRKEPAGAASENKIGACFSVEALRWPKLEAENAVG